MRFDINFDVVLSMKTSELTDRALLQWADEEITCRLQSLAIARADAAAAWQTTYRSIVDDGLSQGYGEMTIFLESLRNNLRLGIRVIDGELPEWGDRPWSERDADHDSNPLTPIAGYE